MINIIISCIPGGCDRDKQKPGQQLGAWHICEQTPHTCLYPGSEAPAMALAYLLLANDSQPEETALMQPSIDKGGHMGTAEHPDQKFSGLQACKTVSQSVSQTAYFSLPYFYCVPN